MRIVSLVPHATELLFALGLGDDVVGVTHECDFPAEARGRTHVTHDRLPGGLSAAEIDAAVRERTGAGDAIYGLDEDRLRALAPELVVTQALCPVCAVSFDDVRALAERMPEPPRVIALDPHTFGETMGDVRTIAQATDSRHAALGLIARITQRVTAVEEAVAGAERPRVAALEWFDPVFVAGHWTPQLIEMAGGEDVLGFPGERSEEVPWELVAAAAPDVVVAMPCGFGAERAREEALAHSRELGTVGAGKVVAVDGGAWFSRPGPRLVEGLEALAHVLHPDRVPEPPGPVLPVAL